MRNINATSYAGSVCSDFAFRNEKAQIAPATNPIPTDPADTVRKSNKIEKKDGDGNVVSPATRASKYCLFRDPKRTMATASLRTDSPKSSEYNKGELRNFEDPKIASVATGSVAEISAPNKWE